MQHPQFEWTAEQSSALTQLYAFLDGPPDVFCLAGYAGTGKTTLIVHALKQLSLRIVFTAPTHKAVGVLASRGILPGAEYRTLHSLLGCRRHRKNGKTEFLPDHDRADWEEFDVIVIDEVSMVGETMWGWIQDAQAEWPRLVVCMGDPAQLPPVKDGDGLSPAFADVDAQLTEIMRSAGIVQRAATRICENLAAPHPVDVELGSDDSGSVQTLGRDAFLAEATAAFRSSEDAKILAWTNDAVDWLNHTMRRQLFGLEVADGPQPDELLCVVRTWASADETVMLHAEAVLRVAEASEEEVKGVPAWRIETDDYGTLYQVRPEGKADFSKIKSNLKFEARRRGSWRPFYEFCDTFIELRPGYATTVHKSQGSTYQTCFVVDQNLCGCPDPQTRNMLRYVAFSRASKRLVIS